MRTSFRSLLVWWTGREPRERLLLSALGVLMAALAYWYGLYVPLQRLADAQAERQSRASTALMQARSLAAEIQTRKKGGAETLDAAAVQRIAAEAAIPLAPEPQANGDLAVNIEAVAAKPLFTWLARLRSELGIGVRRFEAHRADDGGVQAQIVLTGRGS